MPQTNIRIFVKVPFPIHFCQIFGREQMIIKKRNERTIPTAVTWHSWSAQRPFQSLHSHNNKTKITTDSSEKEVSLRSWWQRLLCVACAMHTPPANRWAKLGNVNLIYGQSWRLFEICIAPEGWINMPVVRKSRARSKRERESENVGRTLRKIL